MTGFGVGVEGIIGNTENYPYSLYGSGSAKTNFVGWEAQGRVEFGRNGVDLMR